MQHRSFRLTPVRRIEYGKRVIPRLKLVYACAVGMNILITLPLLAGVMLAAECIRIITGQQLNLWVILGGSFLVVMGLSTVESYVFQLTARIASRYLGVSWITREQAAVFPGFTEAWPECWLEDDPNADHSHPLDIADGDLLSSTERSNES